MFVGKLTLLDDKIDAKLHMQLVDLARMFTRLPSLEVEAAYHSHYDTEKEIMTVSQFWRDLTPSDKAAGMKSDVYLRGIGSAWFTGARAVADYLAFCGASSYPRLANQLLALGEDIRLERICRRIRPGTAKVFEQRHRIYASYFHHKLKVHAEKGEEAEALLLLMYGWFTGASWVSPDRIDIAVGATMPIEHFQARLRPLYPLLEQLEEAEHTAEAADISRAILEALGDGLSKDAQSLYFWLQQGVGVQEPLPAHYRGELKRAKRLANDDALPGEPGERQLPGQERLPTWHRESSDRSPGLLRFELERGTRTAAQGDAPREGDAADQALAIAQARSQRANTTGAAGGARREGIAVPLRRGTARQAPSTRERRRRGWRLCGPLRSRRPPTGA
ncbi:hypothetical protein [Paenibacillus hexagrammi]|uniref:Uncharacterized protein n=1 Tax=Paenibacillus hexagrammi TaxID=2908839 RepID=A0ABY3SQU5_9BACL|nr:hypothetical protein [Paenibacillus sp. YPD9-1]UJF35930.1 hypothetical protein L0M14_13110 [Paenibacillus sp. YPD9-1]